MDEQTKVCMKKIEDKRLIDRRTYKMKRNEVEDTGQNKMYTAVLFRPL
jgi:hypothetical protein